MPRRLRRQTLLRDPCAAAAAYAWTYEEGITASVFALALFVLLGMVALGIDGGRIFDERRRAQNAADHAAIAAAFSACISTSTDLVLLDAAAETAGRASAAENGYDNNGATNDVTITRAPGSLATVPRYQATVATTIETSFARVIGFAVLDTNADAEAEANGCDETGGGPSAVHAGGTSCPGGSLTTLYFSGRDNDITGKTTSYFGVTIPSDDNDFLNSGGPSIEYAGAWSVTGGNNTFVQAQLPVTAPTAPANFPAGWRPSDQTTAMWDAYRNAVLTDANPDNDLTNVDTFEIDQDGIYYTEHTSGAVVKILNTSVDEITIVSRNGPIQIGEPFNPSFGLQTFTAYPAPPGGKAGALFITGFNSNGKPCDDDAIRRSGQGGTWRGIWWAPNGLINVSGNQNHFGDPIARDGGLVGHAVHFRGGNENRVYGGAGAPTADPIVTLTH